MVLSDDVRTSSLGLYIACIFFFKQKTAYEMRISDWSSDVCSSDLPEAGWRATTPARLQATRRADTGKQRPHRRAITSCSSGGALLKIGRASCRERVCQYV